MKNAEHSFDTHQFKLEDNIFFFVWKLLTMMHFQHDHLSSTSSTSCSSVYIPANRPQQAYCYTQHSTAAAGHKASVIQQFTQTCVDLDKLTVYMAVFVQVWLVADEYSVCMNNKYLETQLQPIDLIFFTVEWNLNGSEMGQSTAHVLEF